MDALVVNHSRVMTSHTRFRAIRSNLQSFLPGWLFSFIGKSYFLGRQVYYEFLGLGRLVDSYRLKKNILNTQQVQIGTGFSPKENWLNTDYCPRSLGIYHLNALKRFPFSDNTVAYFYTEHQIEHFTFRQVEAMLVEVYRTLQPGGVARISVPCLNAMIDDYLTRSCAPEQLESTSLILLGSGRTYTSPAIAFNCGFYAFGHQFIYDAETLVMLLERIGFKIIQICDKNASAFVPLQNIDSRDKSLIVDAQK
jgi:predicted SAM-dependent methyltransferase